MALLSPEISLLLYLNSIPPETAKYVFYLSDSVYMLAGLAVLYLLLKRKYAGGIQAILALFFVYAANLALKASIGELRPEFSVAGLHAFDAEITPAFPSTHAALSFAAAGIIGNPLAYIWAALIAVSRVMLGAHYPHDVVAGAVLGYLLSKTLSSPKLSLLFSGEHIFETRRKLFHVFFGALVALAIYLYPKEIYLILISATMAIALVFSGVIKKTGTFPGFSWLLYALERKKDIKNWPLKGTIYFLFGALITALVFEKTVAFASVLILAVGDGASTLVGRPLGVHKHAHNRKKSIEGTVAGIFTSYVAVAFFVPMNAAIMGAIIFGVVESFDFEEKTWIDDNLIIPLAVGAAMSFV